MPAQQGFSCGDETDHAEELARLAAFEQKAARSGPQRAEDILVELERGQYEDSRVAERTIGSDLTRGLQTVELRHADVHQHKVGAKLASKRHGLASVRGLPRDLEVGLGVEESAKAGADDRLVLGKQDADRRAHDRMA
jgi:hypothetical protein